MKRMHWWTVLGLSGTGLAGLLWGQSVLGQPDAKVVPAPPPVVFPQDKAEPKAAPLIPPLIPAQPEVAPAKGNEVKVVPEVTVGTLPLPPLTPSGPGTPTAQPGLNVLPPERSAPPVVAPPRVDKNVMGAVSYEVTPGRQQPGVSIEWVGPTSIRINQPIACQILVRNTSTTPAQNVIVRHRLGQGVSIKASEPNATNDGGELVWNLGTLAPEQARRIDLTLLAQARGSLNCHATVTFTAVAAHQVQVREPQLAVKMRGPEKVIAGENVTLVFAISNPGDGIAEAVKLKTVLPDGLDHARGRVIDFEVGNLAPKETRHLQLICQSKGSGAQKCGITVVGDGGLVASDTTQFEILMPKLDVAMSGPKLRYLDRHAIYTVKIANPGSAPVGNVEVQEAIPAGFKFHQANNGGKYHEATRLVTWNLGELAPGQSKDIAVDLVPIEAGEHRLVAHAQGARGLKSEAEVRTIVEGLPSLSIDVGHTDDPLEVGAETTYEIRVANSGTKMESNVEVICTLPGQLEFRDAKCTAPVKHRLEGNEVVFEPLPRLAPKADVIYRVQVKGVAPGDIRFRTRVKSDGLRDGVQREESTRIYSDDAPVRPGTIAPGTVTPTPTPVPTPGSVIPPPTPAPRNIDSTPRNIEPTPAPMPRNIEPAPVPLPMPGSVIPPPAPAPVPAPMTLPLPPASSAPMPLAIPAPAPTPAPVPLPLPGPGGL